MLIDLIQELKIKVDNLSESSEGQKIISYILNGEILILNEGSKSSIYFKGNLIYKSNFEEYLVSGVLHKRAINAGKISYAPESSAKLKRDSLIKFAQDSAQDRNYDFSYNDKEDEMTIKVLENLRKESSSITKTLGRPNKRIFKI